MNAYKAKANEIRKNLPPPPETPVKQLTDEEIVEFTKNDWLTGKRQDFNRIFNADKVFSILLRQGKLKFTPEQILETIKVVREDNLYRLNRLNPLEAKEFTKRIKNEDFIESQCKKLALVKYFENLSN
jgi:hypothetical protein